MASQIKRGEQKVVSNLLSAIGPVRETTISSTLAYLIYLNHGLAGALFGIHDSITEIRIESWDEHGEDRYDIQIVAGKRIYTVEVKIEAHQADQVRRYSRKQRDLILVGMALWPGQYDASMYGRFVDWERVVSIIETSLKSKRVDEFYRQLAENFVQHLRENKIVRSEFQDVYVRDLSGPSVEIYFNYCLYKCQTQFWKSAQYSRFFAPYFTASNLKEKSRSIIPVGLGISFISKIIVPPFVKSEAEIWETLLNNKYSRQDADHIFEAFGWRRQGRGEHAVFLLGEPMRFVQRPITKADLWGHSGGAMPSTAFDFGDLVAAANGLVPFKSKKVKLRRV